MDAIEDFPAAHSMDTGWFAVDADGHIALFDSSEAGAVPQDGYVSQDFMYDMLDRLRRRPESTPWRTGLVARQGLSLAAPDSHVERPGLVFVRASDPVADELVASGLAQRTPTLAPDEEALVVPAITPALHQRLHRDGACLGCFGDPQWVHGAAQLGLFVYDHLTENWIAGPYGRQYSPSHPLRLDVLPADLGAELARVQFAELRFADAPRVQPVGRTRCLNVRAEYVDEAGVTRPNPDYDE